MNSYIGVLEADYGTRQTPPCYTYKKLSDIRRPPPSNLWVFVDEHPDSINDGWLTDSWPGGGGGEICRRAITPLPVALVLRTATRRSINGGTKPR